MPLGTDSPLTDFLEQSRVVEVAGYVTRAIRPLLYARIFARLTRPGGTRPPRPNDMWIAAATMECGGHLLTFDRDFERIPGLEHTLLVA